MFQCEQQHCSRDAQIKLGLFNFAEHLHVPRLDELPHLNDPVSVIALDLAKDFVPTRIRDVDDHFQTPIAVFNPRLQTFLENNSIRLPGLQRFLDTVRLGNRLRWWRGWSGLVFPLGRFAFLDGGRFGLWIDSCRTTIASEAPPQTISRNALASGLKRQPDASAFRLMKLDTTQTTFRPQGI